MQVLPNRQDGDALKIVKRVLKKNEQVIVMCANFLLRDRDVVRFLNPEGQAVMWWALSAPLPWLGLTETQNFHHPAHPLTTLLDLRDTRADG